MKVCVDSSAMVKLVAIEVESASLREFLGGPPSDTVVVSSSLLETELRRATHARGLSQGVATEVLSRVELHVRTAQVEEIDLLLAYDRRVLEAAANLGIPSASPA